MSPLDLGSRKPNLLERLLNKGFGALVRLSSAWVIILFEVRNRKTIESIRLLSTLWNPGEGTYGLLLADAHNGFITPGHADPVVQRKKIGPLS